MNWTQGQLTASSWRIWPVFAVASVNHGFRMVTVSHRPLKQVFPDTGPSSPGYNFLQPLTIGVLNDADARKLLEHPWAPDVPQFEPAIRDELLKLAGGHPFKLHRAAFHRYAALADPTYDWRAALRDDSLEDVQARVDSYRNDLETRSKSPVEANRARKIVRNQGIVNPYEGYSGLPITGSTFVGRQDVLDTIARHYATGNASPSLVLYGHHCMGKSSVLHKLDQYFRPNILVAYIDMQAASLGTETHQFLLELANAIYRRGIEAGMDIDSVPKESDYANLGTARRSLDAVLEHLAAQIATRWFILAVDEYELIEENIRKGLIDSGLLGYLRAIVSRYHWFGLVFAGQHIREELGHNNRTFWSAAEHIRVSSSLPRQCHLSHYATASRLQTGVRAGVDRGASPPDLWTALSAPAPLLGVDRALEETVLNRLERPPHESSRCLTCPPSSPPTFTRLLVTTSTGSGRM